MFKNRRIGAVAMAFAGLLGIGMLSASNANAYFIDSPVAAKAAVTAPAVAAPVAAPVVAGFVPSTTERGYCIKVGTGDFKNLWLDANTHKCPVYTPITNEYWGPVALGGGDSHLWFKTTTVHLTGSSPATQTVTMSSVPAKNALAPESPAPLTNAASAPAGATVTVTPLAVAAGATDRGYTVTVSGLTVAFDLTIEAFGATPA